MVAWKWASQEEQSKSNPSPAWWSYLKPFINEIKIIFCTSNIHFKDTSLSQPSILSKCPSCVLSNHNWNQKWKFSIEKRYEMVKYTVWSILKWNENIIESFISIEMCKSGCVCEYSRNEMWWEGELDARWQLLFSQWLTCEQTKCEIKKY